MRALTIVAILCFACVPVTAQIDPFAEEEVVLDPVTEAKIQAKQAELAVANEELDRANLALQDRYAALDSIFTSARTGQAPAVRDDITRAFAEAFEAAKKAGKGRRAVKAFSRPAARAGQRLENELLALLGNRVEEAAIEALEKSLDDIEELSADDFAVRVVETLMPSELGFHTLWNESIHSLIDEVGPYAAARRKAIAIETEIQVLRDPKYAHTVGAPPGMVLIPGGTYFVESTYGYKAKKRRQRIKPLYIDLYEVTHGEYWSKFYANLEDKTEKEKFLPRYKDDKGREVSPWFQDAETGDFAPDPDLMELPVTGIDVVAAMAYAKSQGKRLPTEVEWTAAASGAEDSLTEYPWGDGYAEKMANDRKAGVDKPVSVRALKRGRSYFGLHHAAGNVAEITATTVDGKDFEDELPKTDDFVIIATRGGSYLGDPKAVSCKARGQMPALHSRKIDIGFRCARTVPVDER